MLIDPIYVRHDEDLRAHYVGQRKPQEIHLRLNCDLGLVTVEVNEIAGCGVSEAVHHGRHILWSVECRTAQEANKLISAVIPIAERVVEGYHTEFQGGNKVGYYDDEAWTAREEIRALTENR